MKSVSLILPATDETHSLEETVRLAAMYLPSYEVEYLIVTSPKLTTPACRATIAKLAQQYGPRVVAFDQVRPGIGGALQDAFARARGEITVVMASDLETDPAALPNMLQKMEEGYDIVATTRWSKGGGFSGYHPLKLVLNFMFQQMFRILYWTRLTDLTYAYRAYRTEILKGIRWEEARFAFLFECLVKPLRLGYRATEVETPWRARTEGISHASSGDILKYIVVGLRVRFLPHNKLWYSAANDTTTRL